MPRARPPRRNGGGDIDEAKHLPLWRRPREQSPATATKIPRPASVRRGDLQASAELCRRQWEATERRRVRVDAAPATRGFLRAGAQHPDWRLKTVRTARRSWRLEASLSPSMPPSSPSCTQQRHRESGSRRPGAILQGRWKAVKSLAADSFTTQPCFVLHEESGESMAMTNGVGRTKPKIHCLLNDCGSAWRSP